MSTIPQNFCEDSQAIINGLRSRQAKLRVQEPLLNLQNFMPAKSQVVCVISGKGGIGKSLVATNLAVAMSAMGVRTTVLDADFGFANAHLLLGITPRYDISHVFKKENRLHEIIERGLCGVRLIAGGSGHGELAMLSNEDLHYLACELNSYEGQTDVIIIDLPAGISHHSLKFANVAHDIILVSDHEATGQADALTTIGLLAETMGATTIHVVINRARDSEHAVISFRKLWNHVNKRWRGRIKLFFSGWLPHSWYIQSSVMIGKPIVIKHPQSLPTMCIKSMAAKMHKHHTIWRSRQVGRWGVPSSFARLMQMTGGDL